MSTMDEKLDCDTPPCPRMSSRLVSARTAERPLVVC